MAKGEFRLSIEEGVTAVFVPGTGVLRVTNAELREKTGGLMVYWLTTDGKEDSGYWSRENRKETIKDCILSAAGETPGETRIILNSVKQLKFVEETQTTLTIADC